MSVVSGGINEKNYVQNILDTPKHTDILLYELITSSVMPSFLKLKRDSKSRVNQLNRPEHLWQEKEKGRKELERWNDIG